MIKRSVYQNDIKIINSYSPNNRALKQIKYMKWKLAELQGEINYSNEETLKYIHQKITKQKNLLKLEKLSVNYLALIYVLLSI